MQPFRFREWSQAGAIKSPQLHRASRSLCLFMPSWAEAFPPARAEYAAERFPANSKP
jgi:hypothetical protein